METRHARSRISGFRFFGFWFRVYGFGFRILFSVFRNRNGFRVCGLGLHNLIFEKVFQNPFS